jgi:predicted house-cleaning noncanonical NTP pyrophosphatase (MazG superfamily)
VAGKDNLYPISSKLARKIQLKFAKDGSRRNEMKADLKAEFEKNITEAISDCTTEEKKKLMEFINQGIENEEADELSNIDMVLATMRNYLILSILHGNVE